MSLTPHFGPRRGARLAVGSIGLVVSGVLMASVLGLFHQASPPRWLQPTDELLELAASCQELPGRAERLHCTQAVVAAYRERLLRDVVVAQSR